jgi:AraC-like DNA-binding protein
MYLESETVPYGQGRSFASIVFEGPSIICPYHRHPEIELVAIDEGSGRVVAGDYLGTFRGEEMFFLGEDLPHIFQSILQPGGGSRVRTHVIQFRRDFAGEGLFNVLEFRSVSRLLRYAARGLRVPSRLQPHVRESMRRIHGLTGGRRVTVLLELLMDLADSRSLKPLASARYDAAEVPSDGRMPAVMAYIHENLTDKLTVPEAARRAGLSPNAFCRYFKRQTRRTFTDMVNELRVGEASRLLVETPDSVTDVCFASGFGNLAHFHQEFRKRNNTSPLNYRQSRII